MRSVDVSCARARARLACPEFPRSPLRRRAAVQASKVAIEIARAVETRERRDLLDAQRRIEQVALGLGETHPDAQRAKADAGLLLDQPAEMGRRKTERPRDRADAQGGIAERSANDLQRVPDARVRDSSIVRCRHGITAGHGGPELERDTRDGSP